MARPSFARYAALLAGVLDGSSSDGCADAASPEAASGASDALDAIVLDAATRRAACTLRRPSASVPRARPSSLDRAYRAAVVPPAGAVADVRLDRRG